VAGAAERVAEVAVAIEPMRPEDWPAVRAIYVEGIATGVATFDTAAPDWPAWDAAHRPDCRLVARAAGEILGFVALTPWSAREVYAGVAWESIYIAAAQRGRGIGRALLKAVIDASDAAGIWTLMAGIQAENAPSIALHEAAGFRRIGVQERVGRDATGIWRDVVLLERRRD
jgi:L-amino acid N-acyltransferase YncA